MMGERTLVVELSADFGSLALFLTACNSSGRFNYYRLFECVWVLVHLTPHSLDVLQGVSVMNPNTVEDLPNFS
jgi:hypothetical protein